MYRIVVRPVIRYAAETWSWDAKETNVLAVLDRKFLRKITEPVKKMTNGDPELTPSLEIYINNQTSSRKYSWRLGWFGHVPGVEHMSTVKMLFVGNSGSCRKYLEKWLENVENYLRYVGVKRWRLKASVRQEWSVIVRETKFCTELNVTARVAVRRWTVARMTVEYITLDNVVWVCVCVRARVCVFLCMCFFSVVACTAFCLRLPLCAT